MTPFEKYNKIKNELQGLNYNDDSLRQYLHIVQVMSKEEESYKRHRKYMLDWLDNIEKTIYNSVEK